MHPSRSLRTAVLAGSCSAALLWSIPGFAQSHTVQVRDARNTAVIDTDFTSAGIAQLYQPHEPFDALHIAVPPNLTVVGIYRPVVESMLRLSPTFRRQCLRIASASGLDVAIRVLNTHSAPGPRARTQVAVGPDGARHAVVELPAGRDHVELIAHELEHVIEQLDGVDLRRHAMRRATGVRRCDDGSFETTRAVRVGLRVAEEVRKGGG